MTHDQLRLDLRDRIHRDTDYDQQRGAAKIKIYSQTVRDPGRQALKNSPQEREVIQFDPRDHPLRNQRDQNQVERAYQGDPGEDVVDEVRGALTWTDAGNESS